MTAFPRLPRLIKGGIVLIDDTMGRVQRIITLQYNPDIVMRAFQVQGVGQESAVPAHGLLSIVPEVLPSPGQTLDRSMRSFMESRLGYDYSSVRSHTDARAAKSARAVNAVAYTMDRHVVFGQGSMHRK